MKSKKLMRALALCLCIFTLAGCGTSGGSDKKGKRETRNPPIEKETSDGKDSNTAGSKEGNIDEGREGSIDGGEILAASDLQGSVIEFSDNGCVINPVETSGNGEGGSAASITAEGYEDEGAKVTIRYGDNCTFHKAVMDITTGKAAVSEAAISDIKKKTSLVLYGNFDDTENFTASKVVIAQYEY